MDTVSISKIFNSSNMIEDLIYTEDKPGVTLLIEKMFFIIQYLDILDVCYIYKFIDAILSA
jgi:hypothetical protein